jgi:hypothetical protein
MGPWRNAIAGASCAFAPLACAKDQSWPCTITDRPLGPLSRLLVPAPSAKMSMFYTLGDIHARVSQHSRFRKHHTRVDLDICLAAKLVHWSARGALESGGLNFTQQPTTPREVGCGSSTPNKVSRSSQGCRPLLTCIISHRAYWRDPQGLRVVVW